MEAYLLTVARSNLQRRDEVWDFVTNNVLKLEGLFGGTPKDRQESVRELLADVAAGFATIAKLPEVLGLFSGWREAGEGDAQYVDDSVASIRENAYIRDAVIPELCDFLAQQQLPGVQLR
jgi:hypothetical protein